MTIRCEGRTVYHETTIGAKGAWLGALTGGPRTVSLKLSPDKDNPKNDTVEITASYGSHKVKGEDINGDSTCIRHRISWSCY